MKLKNIIYVPGAAGRLVLLLALLMLLAAFGASHMQQMRDDIQRRADLRATQAQLTAAMRASVLERMIVVRDLAPQAPAAEAARLEASARDYARAAARLGQTLSEAGGATVRQSALFARLAQVNAAALPLLAQAAELARAGPDRGAARMPSDRLGPLQRQWLDLLAELGALQEQLGKEAAAQATQSAAAARQAILGFGALACALTAFAVLALTRGLRRQIGAAPEHAAGIAARVARGDLAVCIATAPDDRSSLLFALKTMQDSLFEMVGRVRGDSEMIAAASGRIAADNQSLGCCVGRQAGALSALRDLASTVRQHGADARQANLLLAAASLTAGNGALFAAQAAAAMAAIQAATGKMGAASAAIDDIAFELNLLAVDGAIEADRAATRPDALAALVAEVRQLAERAVGAAKELGVLINDALGKAEAGVSLAGQAGAQIGQALAGIGRAAGGMDAISAASAAQEAGIGQIGQAIGVLDDATRKNANLLARDAAALDRQVRHLAQTLGPFTRAAAPAAPPPVARILRPAFGKPRRRGAPARPDSGPRERDGR